MFDSTMEGNYNDEHLRASLYLLWFACIIQQYSLGSDIIFRFINYLFEYR
jgi:hypothetical protein